MTSIPTGPDRYELPNGTLRNKLGLSSQDELQLAESRYTAARGAFLETRLPKAPFTMETLTGIHRALFQDVYAWAGEPRTTVLGKRAYDDPASPVQSFARPETIDPKLRALFGTLADQSYLQGRSASEFAEGAADAFVSLNAIHPFREGNGRSQRLLLSAMARDAGHELAFDIMTRERMVAVSIDAHRGDIGGVRRLFAEIIDPEQVAAMRKAIGFMATSKQVPWNDMYVSTARPGQDYAGTLVGRGGSDFMLLTRQDGAARIVVGDARDLPAGAVSGAELRFRSTRFGPDPDGAPPRTAIGSIVSGMASRPSAQPAPWEPPPFDAGRVRAFEAQAKAKADETTKPKAEPAPEPDAKPRRSGPTPQP